MDRRAFLTGCALLAFGAAARAQPECAATAATLPAIPGWRLPRDVRIGLALGSGSMHGYAHLGVLQEIEDAKLPVDILAGTSVGALVGGLWASGMAARDIAALAQRENLAGLSELARSWQGLLSSEPLRTPLEAAFRGRSIERWPKRFGAVATHLASGERRLIASGDGATAIRASSAVPVLYRPVTVNGERLGDGALVEPVPVRAARDLGANLVIAIDVGYRPHEEEASGLMGYAFQAMHILVNALAVEQLREADVAIRLNVHRRFMECGAEGLVEAGRDAMRRAWPEVLSALSRRAR